jgi:hypothetical protein
MKLKQGLTYLCYINQCGQGKLHFSGMGIFANGTAGGFAGNIPNAI